MLPKEKAAELVEKMVQTISDNCEHNSYCSKKECTYKGIIVCVVTRNEVKEAAIIAVDEVLLSFNSFMDSRRNFRHELEIDAERYWLSVKAEIEKIK